MIEKIKDYLRLIKFSHTVFALPFALVGYFLAYIKYETNWLSIIYIILCMIFARSSAMAFNRYLDRKFDKLNPRTKNREIPAGKISEKNALFFTIIMSILFIITTMFINKLVFYLSFITLFIILGYSFTKLFTPLCHLILGLGLGLSPIGAFLTISNKFEITPILFSVLVFLWVSGFDIIYALQDYEFDKKNNLKSIPVLFGKNGALIISLLLHLLALILLVVIGFSYNFSYFYWIGALIFSKLLIYQHLIIKPNDLSKVNIAFGTTNGIASIIFAVFVILDLII
jgi:4-hydroxybenzoate polyprenyltransferase